MKVAQQHSPMEISKSLDNYFSIWSVWETAMNSWVANLFTDKTILKLSRFKYGKILYNFYQRVRFYFIRKPIMPIAEYVVTTHCTMNCKHCNTFMPYFTKDTHLKMVAFETFKNDIDRLLKSVDYIYCFGFVGGEPLLAKDLYKMLNYALSKKQIKHIFIATNCTIMPSQKLLDAMKNRKFVIRTSNYSEVKNIKGNVVVKYEQVKKVIKDNGISLSDPQMGKNTWITAPELFIDKQESKKLSHIYKKCDRKFCNMLCDGVLLPCTAAVYMRRNMELSNEIKQETVDIRNNSSKELTKKIIDFYSQAYSNYCHYCHTENTQYNLPCGEQLE